MREGICHISCIIHLKSKILSNYLKSQGIPIIPNYLYIKIYIYIEPSGDLVLYVVSNNVSIMFESLDSLSSLNTESGFIVQ